MTSSLRSRGNKYRRPWIRGEISFNMVPHMKIKVKIYLSHPHWYWKSIDSSIELDGEPKITCTMSKTESDYVLKFSTHPAHHDEWAEKTTTTSSWRYIIINGLYIFSICEVHSLNCNKHISKGLWWASQTNRATFSYRLIN